MAAKVYIKGGIVKKVSLAVDCKVREFGSYSRGSGGPLKVSGLRSSLARFRESSLESAQDDGNGERLAGNGVELWEEAVVW